MSCPINAWRNFKIINDYGYMVLIIEDVDCESWDLTATTLVKMREHFQEHNEEQLYNEIFPHFPVENEESLEPDEIKNINNLPEPQYCIEILIKSKSYKSAKDNILYQLEKFVTMWGKGFKIFQDTWR